MKYDVISSGSKGNCTLIFSKGHCIQIDFGISKKRVVDALKSYEKTFDDVEAVFVTHSHSDHCAHIERAKDKIVFASTPSLPRFPHVIDNNHLLKPFQKIVLPPFTITVLPLSHDAKNTVGFIIDDGEERLCYVTDTGFIPEKEFPYLINCDYYIFESNHDPEMLYTSSRPDCLIKRIISDKGHLSNQDSAYYLSIFIGDKTKEIVLAHLSEECNTPQLARTSYEKGLKDQLGFVPSVKVMIASSKEETRGGQ